MRHPFLQPIEIATRSADASGMQGILDLLHFFMEVMLTMLETQGNLRIQNFKTFRRAKLTKHRKYQRCRECWGPQKVQTTRVFIFPKINHQKQILATPFKYSKNRLPKARLMQGMFRSNCSVQLGNCKKHYTWPRPDLE